MEDLRIDEIRIMFFFPWLYALYISYQCWMVFIKWSHTNICKRFYFSTKLFSQGSV